MSNYLIKFNEDGSINTTSGSNIFQYSSGANVVEIQADLNDAWQYAVVTISIVRADATELSAKPCVAKLGEDMPSWVYTFDNIDLAVEGDLDFAFTISYNGVDLTTEAITGTVQTSFNNGYTAVDPTMTEEILQWLANLQVDKVGRYDIEDLPVDITYTADGLKTANNLFFNAEFTIGETLTAGTLLVTATGTTTISQQEVLFAGTQIFRRVLTINGETVTVGDWENYSTEITEAITTHNTSGTAHSDIRTAISDEATARENADIVLQENIDAIAESNVTSVNGQTGVVTLGKADIELGNVDNTSDLNKPVSTATQTELDKKVNITDTSGASVGAIYNANGITSGVYRELDTPQINAYSRISTLAGGSSSSVVSSMSARHLDKQTLEDHLISLVVKPTKIEKFVQSSDEPDAFYEILDTSTGLTKAAQTLTSEEQSQVQTNIDVYSKTEVDNKVASVYKYKGSVATYEDLPIEDLSVGDVYNVIDTGDNYAWTGTAWDKLGGEVDLSNYLAKDNTTAFTPTGDYNPATKKYVDDNQLELGETSTTAYAGDKGKTAYDHSQLTSGNPHSVSKSDVGLGNVVNPNTYGNIAVSDNLDDIVYTGFYTCYGSATGAPSEDYSWFVVHLNSGVGTTYAKQIAFAYDGIQYERFKNTTWGAWIQKSKTFATPITVATTDFVSNLTYSQFPYRASKTVTGMLSTDFPNVFFSAADINLATANGLVTMVIPYTNGIHIYASALPDDDLTIEKIDLVRGA